MKLADLEKRTVIGFRSRTEIDRRGRDASLSAEAETRRKEARKKGWKALRESIEKGKRKCST